jgi:hypothetical protein
MSFSWLLDKRSGLESRQRHDICVFARTSRPALGPTQPRVQRVPGGKARGSEADY